MDNEPMDIDFAFQEPKSADYIYIDDQNKVHVLIPIVGGETIGLDNTCKTAMEFQAFFFGKDKKKSALYVLENYQKNLVKDIELLHEMSIFSKMMAQKEERLEQINEYITLLKKVDNCFTNPNEPFPALPEAVHSLFEKQNNCFTMHLSPKIPDHIMRTRYPTFSLKRPKIQLDHYHMVNSYSRISGLAPELITQITDMLKKSKAALTVKDQLIAAVDTHYKNKPKPSLEQLQEYARQLIFEKYHQDVDLKKAQNGDSTSAYLESINMPYNEECSVSECIRNVLLTTLSDDFWNGLKNDKLIEADPQLSVDANAEKMAMAIQFFLATINIYCKAKGLSKTNFGPILDQLRVNIARRVVASLASPDAAVEEVLFTIIDELKDHLQLSRKLSQEEKKQIINEYRLHYSIIKDSPHFDEFIIFRDDIQGDFFNHQNRISISLLDLINHANLADDVREKAAPLQSNLKNLKSQSIRKLRPQNPGLSAEFEDFLTSFNIYNCEKIAKFLCSQISNSDDLIKRFNYHERQAMFNHPLWPQISYCMLNDLDKSKAYLYQEAIHQAQNNLLMIEKKFLTPCGSAFDSQLFKAVSRWNGIIENLQQHIQSYESRFKYRLKTDERKSQVVALKQISMKLTNISTCPLTTQISILIEMITQLNHLSANIQKQQHDKKSTLAKIIDGLKTQIIEEFHLDGSPIVLNWENPLQSLIEFQNNQLAELAEKHPFLHQLDTQWWSAEGMSVIKQLPSNCFEQASILQLNTTRPEQFNEYVLKAIQTDGNVIQTDFSNLELRGKFIQYIDNLKDKEALLKLNSLWWPSIYRDKLTAISFEGIPEKNITFLNKINPALLDKTKLKGLICQMRRKQEIQNETLESLNETGRRCEILGLDQYDEVFDKLHDRWWTEENIAKIRSIEKPINQYLIQFLNTIQPHELTADTRAVIKENWSPNKIINSKVLPISNTFETFTVSSSTNNQKAIIIEEFRAAIEHTLRTQKTWFDVLGVKKAKNEYIKETIEKAINLIEKDKVNDAQNNLQTAKLFIRLMYQGNKELVWSWFSLRYTLSSSEKFLNQLIEKLDQYKKMKCATQIHDSVLIK